jgi:hypothetical protein
MNIEQLVEWELAGETEVLGDNLESNPDRRVGKLTTNLLSCGTAHYGISLNVIFRIFRLYPAQHFVLLPYVLQSPSSHLIHRINSS